MIFLRFKYSSLKDNFFLFSSKSHFSMTGCQDQVYIDYASRLSSNYAIGTWKVHGNNLVFEYPYWVHTLLPYRSSTLVEIPFLDSGRGQWPILSHMQKFLLLLLLLPLLCPPNIKALIPASSHISQPRGLNPSLEAQIPASKLKSQPSGSNPSFKA